MESLGFAWDSGQFLVIWQCLLFLIIVCALAIITKMPVLGYKAKTPKDNKVDGAT
jgi:hypothetical protein